MHTFMDAKLMAKLLRQALAERSIDITHSDGLELVSRQFGLANWNMLSARIEAAERAMKPLVMPEGWTDGSANHDGYFSIGLDPARPGCAMIQSTPMASHAPASHFGTMSQSISAEDYKGGAVRLTCELACEHLDGAGTIWLRVDGQRSGALRFDNLLDQPGVPISGTHDWKPFSVTLDVPDEAASIHFGFLMRGRGKLWGRDFAVEKVAATNEPARRRAYRNERPTNLGFA
jgi:hypothetical protein